MWRREYVVKWQRVSGMHACMGAGYGFRHMSEVCGGKLNPKVEALGALGSCIRVCVQQGSDVDMHTCMRAAGF